MLLPLITLLLTPFAVHALYLRWIRRHFYACFAKLDGPINLPLIGCCYHFIGTGKTLRILLDRYRAPMGCWMGPHPVVVISAPEHCQAVLNFNDCLRKSVFYRFLGLPDGLVTADKCKWKQRRKVMNFAFTSSIVNNFVEDFNQKARLFVNNSKRFADVVERDISPMISEWALDTIFATLLQFDLNSYRDKTELTRSAKMFLPLAVKRLSNIYHYPDYIYTRSKDFGKLNRTRKAIRRATAAALDHKLTKEKTSYRKLTPSNERHIRPMLYLDMLIDMLKDRSLAMDEEDLLDHLEEIIYTSFDSISATLSNVLQMLAIHPLVQERVFREVTAIFPNETDALSQEVCHRLLYLRMTIKETLRLFPVFPVFGRSVSTDFQLDDRTTLPEGTQVLISTGKLHRDPSVWGPQANSLDPDNFGLEKTAQRPPYSFLPFGGGSRNCIGTHYAMLLLVIAVAHLVRTFRFRTSLRMEDLVTSGGALQRIENGCRVSLEPRSENH
ncbi:probable cytochrome P450 313a4 isoform X1 [Uranotaenia lowii]|uniref:probable cytochrome P450 313a4 isoform X1 n=2 Tax=Uranotaenia lowii TaxID=190385 RepID=UPI00247B1790|nr:probable cytochrome P450 313a4 isoform X1 [Uranotaenia lowii]